MTVTTLQYAQALVNAGYSVIPIKADASKAAAVPWKPYQSRLPNSDEIQEFFSNGYGIAVLAGAVSGNLEIIDIESRAPFQELVELIHEHAPDLLAKLPRVSTPSGGEHLFYRCATIQGNQKLAMDSAGKVLIETRGEGGYVVTVGSPLECHPSGKPYVLSHGRITQSPMITPEERSILLACCRSFNQFVTPQSDVRPTPKPNGHGLRPGDDYNQRGDVLALLLKHGWSIGYRRGDETYLRRPGKDSGSCSASLGKVAPNVLYVFSSNAHPFEFERAYDAFGVYSRLEHGGDLNAATKSLAAQGYGIAVEPPPSRSNVRDFKKPPTVSISELNQPVTDGSTAPELSSSRGSAIGNLNNAMSILENDPKLRGVVWYDEFLNKIMTRDTPQSVPREWQDHDDLSVTLYMQRRCGVEKMGRESVNQAIVLVSRRTVKNCVRDWMQSVEWDRIDRISQFFEDHFGVTVSAYSRAVSHNFWVSLVARTFDPGCKVDNMIILEGNQGIRKSSALHAIAREWFTEQHESVTNPKAFAEVLQGKLIVEIAEMDAFRGAELTRVKAAISNQKDTYREPFAKYASDHPRRCVFAGTTNKDESHRDETGARRFWFLACTEVDVEAINANRDQLFAEAVFRYRNNEHWWDMPADETRIEQDKRFESDSWSEPIQDFLSTCTSTTVKDILTDQLQIRIGDIKIADQQRVAKILRHLGWIGRNERYGGKVIKRWRPN